MTMLRRALSMTGVQFRTTGPEEASRDPEEPANGAISMEEFTAPMARRGGQ